MPHEAEELGDLAAHGAADEQPAGDDLLAAAPGPAAKLELAGGTGSRGPDKKRRQGPRPSEVDEPVLMGAVTTSSPKSEPMS